MNLTRRTALAGMAAGIAGTMAGGCVTGGGGKSAAKRPNILFIMTDDQAADQMSCYGNPVLHTPNMDRLANEGNRFDTCFCTNSLCAPSRASVLTGCYSYLNGVRGNSEAAGETESINPACPTFPELLQHAGWQTALIGKWHLTDDPKGFDTWRILPGQGVYFDPEFIENGTRVQEQGYVTDIITDKALAWLRQADRSRPFCLVYQHKGPHRPFTPAPRHARLYDGIELPRPPAYDDDYSTRMVAGLARDMRFDVSLASDYPDLPTGLSPAEKKDWIFDRFVKDHYRALASIDENLGRVLDYLDEAGLADDTLVIYTTDNGFYLGEHGWYDKRFMYEPSLRLPLVIRYPRLSGPGQVSTNMTLNVDFAPTILDIAGVPVPETMHGTSLRPLLAGENPAGWRRSIYYAYYENSWRLAGFSQEDLRDPTFQYFTAHRVGPHHGVRTDRYKLIHYYSEGDYREFFDLRNDPHELKNLYGDLVYAEEIAALEAELTRLQKLYGPPEA